MSSRSANHLSSIQDNPFIRHYGLPHHRSQQDFKCVPSAVNCSKTCDNQNDDQEQEYHVNSGFVHKLTSKFTQLESKSKQVSLSRKSASVENLLNFGNHSSMNNLQHGGTNLTSDDSCIVSLSKLELYVPVGYESQMKPNNQDVNWNIDKAPFAYKNIIGSVKPPLPQRPSAELSAPKHRVLKSGSKNGAAKVRSVHHDWAVAPDVEVIGRDNIIIIESSKLSKSFGELEAQKNTKDSTQITNDNLRLVKPLTSIEKSNDEYELRKPKTVSAYKTLFESNPNAVSDTSKEESPRTSINLNTETFEVPMDKIGPCGHSITVDVDTKDNSLTNDCFSRQESTQHINITSTSVQKSWELFQNLSENKGPTVEINSSCNDDKSQNESINITQLKSIPNVQHALSPVHSTSIMFDSKSNKSTEKVDRPKHSKSQLVTRQRIPKDTVQLAHKAGHRRSRELENINCPKTPKDTIELKHETDHRRSLELENVNCPKTPKATIKLKHETDTRRSRELENINCPKTPKDTIELKHEADHRRSLELENVNCPKTPKATIKLKHETDNRRSRELENINFPKTPKDTIELKHETDHRRSLELENVNCPKTPKATIKLKHETDNRRSRELENINFPKTPKDTIELKHEADQRRSLELENVNCPKTPKDTIELKHEDDQRLLEMEERNNQNSEIESRNDVSSQASTDKKNEIIAVVTAPGKLLSRKVFDSSCILKKDKKLQKVKICPVKNVSASTVTNNVLDKVTVVDDLKILQVEQHKKQTEPDSSDKVDTSAISHIETKININAFKVQSSKFLNVPSESSKNRNDSKSSPTVENVEAPVSGMSTFLTSRLKKSQPDNENLLAATFMQPANGCSPAPAPRKRHAPELTGTKGSLDVEMTNEKSSPSLPCTPVPELPNTSMDSVVRRAKKSPQMAAMMVFDSSKIATKRKEPPKKKSQRKAMNELNKNNNDQLDCSVPKLNLSSKANEKLENDYQEGYIPTVIQPCPYIFIGAEVIFDKTPYKKSKKVKVKISFDDHEATTFEYQGEDLALENYLEKHPDERDEVVKQEQELESNMLGQNPGDLLDDSPPALIQEPESQMKPTNVIGLNTGALTSYKSKMQTQEFQFGVQTEPASKIDDPDLDLEPNEPESFHILPADDNEVDTFSSEINRSDMLF